MHSCLHLLCVFSLLFCCSCCHLNFAWQATKL
uniref:Uncharacterized protein n=1 Tax=Rhizophora mucronata TaxID=61149 RepID=A0A2P2QG36_RHIMU